MVFVIGFIYYFSKGHPYGSIDQYFILWQNNTSLDG